MKGNWIGNRSTARHRGAFLLVGAQSENTSSPTDALGAQQLPDENISHPASALHLPAARRPYWSATLGRTIAFVPRSRTASWNFGDDSSVSTVLDNNGFHYFFFGSQFDCDYAFQISTRIGKCSFFLVFYDYGGRSIPESWRKKKRKSDETQCRHLRWGIRYWWWWCCCVATSEWPSSSSGQSGAFPLDAHLFCIGKNGRSGADRPRSTQWSPPPPPINSRVRSMRREINESTARSDSTARSSSSWNMQPRTARYFDQETLGFWPSIGFDRCFINSIPRSQRWPGSARRLVEKWFVRCYWLHSLRSPGGFTVEKTIQLIRSDARTQSKLVPLQRASRQ